MKALKLLKILRDDYIHGELDKDINEAINELEEAQLTRRELYQKGYNEAMNKTCHGCYWWNDFYSKCDNHDNGLAGVGDYGCNRHEPKDNA